jgi:hypothetical protein
MKCSIPIGLCLSIVLTGLLTADAVAQKPGKGGSGGGTSAAYDLFRLTPPGSVAGSVEALHCNNSANVVGWYNDANGLRNGFFYNHAARSYTSLGLLVEANDLTHANAIVGYDQLQGMGLYWSSPTAPPISLPPLPIHTHSAARAINGDGIIVGVSFSVNPNAEWIEPGSQSLVAWHVSSGGVVTGPVELPFLSGDWAGRVMDVSEFVGGVASVVGSSGDTAAGNDAVPLPVAWSLVLTTTGIEVFGPMLVEGNYDVGDANGVNAAGTIVGAAGVPTGQAFLKALGQPMQLLPMLTNAVSGHAQSINASGSSVGLQNVQPRRNSTVQRTAVLWPTASSVVDLNTQVSLASGERLEQAFDINTRGDILVRSNQGSRVCLLIKK